MRVPNWLPVLVLLALPAGVTAQEKVVIYRCTALDGAVTVQNDEPCPKGSKQERRAIETAPPPSQPYVPPSPAPPAPSAAAVEPVLMPMPDKPEAPRTVTPAQNGIETGIEIERRPPPALFSCRTWERKDYLTDSEVPAERCAAMRTTGLDGAPNSGAGTACMVVADACQPVPEAALCDRWRQLLQANEATVEFGRADDPAAAVAELERVRAIVERNLCDG